MLTLLRRKSVLVGLSLLPLLGAILLFGLLARRHVADRGAVPNDLHPPAKPVVVIRNFTYSRTFRSQTRWFVKAREAQVGQGQSRTTLTDLSAHIILSRTLSLFILSQEGTIDRAGHQFLVSGRTIPVSAAFSTGLRVVSKQLHYHAASDTITTGGEVTLVGRGIVIHGEGLSSRPKTQSFTVERNVHAVFAG